MTFKNGLPIEIPKRSLLCSKGGEPLEPGVEYYSVLMEEGENRFLRKDFCLDCWNKHADDLIALALSYWKSTVPKKNKEAVRPKAREERIFHLFKKAAQADNPEEMAEAFVLALYLARKKKLIMRQEIHQPDNEIIQIYEDPENEEVFGIRKFPLSALGTEKIQLALARKING